MQQSNLLLLIQQNNLYLHHLFLKVNEHYKLNQFFNIFILGSCLALNLSYSGCCVRSLLKSCSNDGCFCDQHCHKWNDCCSDIGDIGCHPISSFFPSPTPKDKLGKTNQQLI